MSLVPFDLWRHNDWCNQTVVGESFHLDDIRNLFPARLPEHAEVATTADLVPEPNNPHDANAVAVSVGGRVVGHLPREDAVRFQPVLIDLVSRGLQPQAPCVIHAWEWTDRDYDRHDRVVESTVFNASISVALDEPHLCAPINSAPEVPYLVMPTGYAIQVSGEEAHLDALAPLLRPEGEAWVYATVHGITEQRKTPRELVEVRIDGKRVGQLTPKMSGELLPAIRHLEAAGFSTAVSALVQGNRLKAEVVLYTARAHQLPADWPGDLTSAPATSTPFAAPSGEVPQPIEPRVPASGHFPVPPRPTRIRFNIPPTWPQSPAGWEPTPGWEPPPEWPPAPADWTYWVIEE